MEYIERLKQSLSSLEESADKLSKIPELISLTGGLAEEFVGEKKELDKIKDDIEENTKTIKSLTEKNEKILDTTISTVKEELIRNKKETLEAVDSISITISNKINVLDSNLDAAISLKANDIQNTTKQIVEDKGNKIHEKLNSSIIQESHSIQSVEMELLDSITIVNSGIVELKKELNITKNIAIAATILGIISVILSIAL